MGEDIQDRFNFNGATPEQIQAMETLRSKFKEIAIIIEEFPGHPRLKALAYTKLEEAQMWANKGITHLK